MLKIKNLTKKYGELIAVNQLNLQISKGEFFGLLGPNGAGKSTTIRLKRQKYYVIELGL